MHACSFAHPVGGCAREVLTWCAGRAGRPSAAASRTRRRERRRTTRPRRPPTRTRARRRRPAAPRLTAAAPAGRAPPGPASKQVCAVRSVRRTPRAPQARCARTATARARMRLTHSQAQRPAHLQEDSGGALRDEQAVALQPRLAAGRDGRGPSLACCQDDTHAHVSGGADHAHAGGRDAAGAVQQRAIHVQRHQLDLRRPPLAA